VGGEVDIERRHGASLVLRVAAYGAVVIRGLGVGVVRLTDSMRGVQQRGRQGHGCDGCGRLARVALPGKMSRGWGSGGRRKGEGGRGCQVSSTERGNQLT
jgi:hypothetical protein